MEEERAASPACPAIQIDIQNIHIGAECQHRGKKRQQYLGWHAVGIGIF